MPQLPLRRLAFFRPGFAAGVSIAALILGCAPLSPGEPAGPPRAAAPVTAVATSDSGATAPAAPDAEPDVNLSGALLYQLMTAEVAAQRGDIGTAYSIYLKLARETRDARLARRATELALQGRALTESLEAARLWHELAPQSPEASPTLAMLHAANGQFDAAHALF